MDKQKVIESLTLVELQTRLTSAPQHVLPTSLDLSALRSEFISLLSLVYGSVTRLSLALKPSSPNYSASLSPLQDLARHTSALSHCLNFFDPKAHGATLIQEILSVIKDVFESVRALVRTFLNIESNGTHDGQAGDEYMVRTGAVHDVIDRARALPCDNVDAVRRKWEQDRGSLEDGLREVAEIIKDEEDGGDHHGENMGEEGDGWDELGLGSGGKMDQDELERTKKVHSILRLTTVLHKRILAEFLTQSSSSFPENATFDALALQSSLLLSCSDELISTLYTPQDPLTLFRELNSFLDVIKALQNILREFLPDHPLEAQLGLMNIESEASITEKGIQLRNWFKTCFGLIYKSTEAFAATLEQNAGT